MEKLETIDNYYILAFAYRVYNVKLQNIILNLDNDVEEERLSRICSQLMYAMDSYYEKGLISLTAISDYEIYKSAYSYTLGLIKKNQSNLIWSKSALEILRLNYMKKLLHLKIFITIQLKTALHNSGKPFLHTGRSDLI